MNTLPKLLSLLFFMIPLFFGIAQKSNTPDSTAIVSYADKFVVKLNLDTQTDTYDLRNLMDDTRFRIAPNNAVNFYLSLDYQFFGLSFGFSPSLLGIENDTSLKGESEFSDFRFRAALGQWIQGFQISSIKGYYIENTGDFVPNWVEGVDPYIQLSDFKSQIYGMSTSYVFNPNFSFRNILYNTEWQKRSAGSFIPTLFYSYDRISYTQDDIKVKEDIYPIRLSLGYFYTLVIRKHWFVNANLAPSFGIRFSNTTSIENDMETKFSSTAFIRSVEGGLNLGYASRKIVFGLSFTFDVNGYDDDKFNAVENNKVYGNIYFGYRFNTPGFVDRTYNKFAEKVGLD